jgi:hypothetical protein
VSVEEINSKLDGKYLVLEEEGYIEEVDKHYADCTIQIDVKR